MLHCQHCGEQACAPAPRPKRWPCAARRAPAAGAHPHVQAAALRAADQRAAARRQAAPRHLQLHPGPPADAAGLLARRVEQHHGRRNRFDLRHLALPVARATVVVAVVVELLIRAAGGLPGARGSAGGVPGACCALVGRPCGRVPHGLHAAAPRQREHGRAAGLHGQRGGGPRRALRQQVRRRAGRARRRRRRSGRGVHVRLRIAHRAHARDWSQGWRGTGVMLRGRGSFAAVWARRRRRGAVIWAGGAARRD